MEGEDTLKAGAMEGDMVGDMEGTELEPRSQVYFNKYREVGCPPPLLDIYVCIGFNY